MVLERWEEWEVVIRLGGSDRVQCKMRWDLIAVEETLEKNLEDDVEEIGKESSNTLYGT